MRVARASAPWPRSTETEAGWRRRGPTEARWTTLLALLLFGRRRRFSTEATGTRARVREKSARDDGITLDGSCERVRPVACSISACASVGSGPCPRPWSPLRIFHVTRRAAGPFSGRWSSAESAQMRLVIVRIFGRDLRAGQFRRSTPVKHAPIDIAGSRSTVSRESERSTFDRHLAGDGSNPACAFSEGGTTGVATRERAEPRARRARERGVARISRRSTREGFATTDPSVSTRARELWWTSGARR